MAQHSNIVRPNRRADILILRRNQKMARSAHAYMRGNTTKFYEWLDSTAGKALPDGPSVWICGDCHVGNLGPLASVKGRVDIQIRDLDQTVIGNPAHDLIRLGLSLATAVRSSNLPGITTAHMIENMISGYEGALLDTPVSQSAAGADVEAIQRVMQQALRRRWKHLAHERIRDVEPTIPRGDKFWDLSRAEENNLKSLLASEKLRKLVTSLHNRKNDAPIRLLDAAYWVKGCSSLGRLRYAVLVGVGHVRKEGAICFLDIKEATTAAAPRAPDAKMPKDNAMRVVEGARNLAPNLGERMMAAKLADRSVVVRELLPQDLKLEVDQLTQEEAVNAARYLASVVGRAHARQMDDDTRHRWSRVLGERRSKTLDAPSWLWSSIVDLVGIHEASYLEHCRRLMVAA